MKMGKYRIHSLQQKILLSFLLIVLIFTVIGIAGYRLSIRNSYNLTVEAVDTSLRHINREASTALHDIQDRAYEVAEDPELQEALRKGLSADIREVYKERLNFNNWLYYESIRVKHIDGLYVLGENGAMFHATYSFRSEDYRDTEWYRQVVETRQALWIAPHKGSELGNNLDFITMSILVPVQDRASTRILGVVAAEVLMKDLGQIVFEDLAFDGTLCITDENNRIIYFQIPREDDTAPAVDEDTIEGVVQSIGEGLKQTADQDEEKDYVFLTIDGEKYITVFSELSDSPWKLVCLVSSRKVLADHERLLKIIICSGILAVLAGVLLSVLVSHGIVKPVRTMQTVMKEAEQGDFSVRVKDPGGDEIGDLGRGLNHMIGRIDALMESEREAQEKLKKADLNALQSQINPHFLYNTLDSINWMARMGKTEQVEEMIDSLTSFLRIGLSRGRTFISLQEEIKHVESYFSIQKVRYHSILYYKVLIPEELYHYTVIKMTLQPLVENALYHGIKEKDAPGTITVQARQTDKDLIITVEDDGLGMTPERLLEVQEMMNTGTAKNNDAYGIINVQRRIQSYFGKEYGLSFDSKYREGTIVTVILPKKETVSSDV